MFHGQLLVATRVASNVKCHLQDTQESKIHHIWAITPTRLFVCPVIKKHRGQKGLQNPGLTVTVLGHQDWTLLMPRVGAFRKSLWLTFEITYKAQIPYDKYVTSLKVWTRDWVECLLSLPDYQWQFGISGKNLTSLTLLPHTWSSLLS